MNGRGSGRRWRRAPVSGSAGATGVGPRHRPGGLAHRLWRPAPVTNRGRCFRRARRAPPPSSAPCSGGDSVALSVPASRGRCRSGAARGGGPGGSPEPQPQERGAWGRETGPGLSGDRPSVRVPSRAGGRGSDVVGSPFERLSAARGVETSGPGAARAPRARPAPPADGRGSCQFRARGLHSSAKGFQVSPLRPSRRTEPAPSPHRAPRLGPHLPGRRRACFAAASSDAPVRGGPVGGPRRHRGVLSGVPHFDPETEATWDVSTRSLFCARPKWV